MVQLPLPTSKSQPRAFQSAAFWLVSATSDNTPRESQGRRWSHLREVRAVYFPKAGAGPMFSINYRQAGRMPLTPLVHGHSALAKIVTGPLLLPCAAVTYLRSWCPWGSVFSQVTPWPPWPFRVATVLLVCRLQMCTRPL